MNGATREKKKKKKTCYSVKQKHQGTTTTSKFNPHKIIFIITGRENVQFRKTSLKRLRYIRDHVLNAEWQTELIEME